jgi:hypothetical protein
VVGAKCPDERGGILVQTLLSDGIRHLILEACTAIAATYPPAHVHGRDEE